MDESKLPKLLELKWRSCETQAPKFDDYYIIKHDNKHYEWFLSYYLSKEGKFLCVDCERKWKLCDPQPWRWAELPRIKQENTLFDLGLANE